MARQPINLVVLKGKSHRTKAEIQERQEREVKAASDRVTAPGYLPKELKLEFNKIAKELLKIELISNLDTDALARFILARSEYVRTIELLRSIDPGDDIKFYNLTLTANNTLFGQCRAAASDLGLTISSRCKLLVPKPKEKEPSEFDERFGGV